VNLARRIATVEGRLPAAARRCRRSSERIRFSSAILPPYARHGLAEERAGLPANRGGRGAVCGGGSMVETAVLTVREDSNNALARAQDRQGAAGGGEVTTY